MRVAEASFHQREASAAGGASPFRDGGTGANARRPVRTARAARTARPAVRVPGAGAAAPRPHAWSDSALA